MIHKGMNTYHAQEKDRTNWQRSMDKRNELVDTLEKLNIHIEKPHEMKMKDLESLVNNHRTTVKRKKWKYLTFSEIAVITGVNAQTLRSRIRKGMTLEQAIIKPVTERIKLTKRQVSTAESNGISKKLIFNRVNSGWKLNDAITLPKGTRRKPDEPPRVELTERELRTAKQERRELRRHRQAKRIALLDRINYLEETDGDKEQIESLERELAKV